MAWTHDDGARLTDARVTAESNGEDRALMDLRRLERAAEELPATIDGVRRGRLLGADALGTTWSGWVLRTGKPALLGCIAPGWRTDPVMRRRLARASRFRGPGLLIPSWRPDGDWPHLRLVLPGPLAPSLLPAEDPPEPAWIARLLAHGLQGLATLHAAGRSLGGRAGAALVIAPQGEGLAWLDPFESGLEPERDLADLARTLAAFDPDGHSPAGRLAASWSDACPPTAADGLALLHRELREDLLRGRHHLAGRLRRAGRFDRVAALSTAVRRLEQALSPPISRTCLKVEPEGGLWLLRSDGNRIEGGQVSEARHPLPLVYDPSRGLDALGARALMRAWTSRSKGDEGRRRELQIELGGTDAQAMLLMRWLAARARLRAARLLMEAQARMDMPHLVRASGG